MKYRKVKFMNKYMQKYFKKCKTKMVMFYPKDKALLDYAATINFQKFVKDALRKEMEGK